MKLKTVAMTGVLALAGLGLIGVGAHAAFTQNTTSSQTISAGSIAVVVSAPGAVENPYATNCSSPGDNCTTITLPAQGPFGSTFDTTPVTVTITNNSPFTVTDVSAVSDTNTSLTMETEMGMCFWHSGAAQLNGYLTQLEAVPSWSLGNTIASGGTDTYSTDFYAGTTSSECGSTPVGAASAPTASADSLTSGAEGGSVTPTITFTYSG